MSCTDQLDCVELSSDAISSAMPIPLIALNNSGVHISTPQTVSGSKCYYTIYSTSTTANTLFTLHYAGRYIYTIYILSTIYAYTCTITYD